MLVLRENGKVKKILRMLKLRRGPKPKGIELVEPLLSEEEREGMSGDAGSRTIFTMLERNRHPCLLFPAVREHTDKKGNKKIEPVKTGKEAEAPTVCMNAVEKEA